MHSINKHFLIMIVNNNIWWFPFELINNNIATHHEEKSDVVIKLNKYLVIIIIDNFYTQPIIGLIRKGTPFLCFNIQGITIYLHILWEENVVIKEIDRFWTKPNFYLMTLFYRIDWIFIFLQQVYHTILQELTVHIILRRFNMLRTKVRWIDAAIGLLNNN